MKKAQRSYLSIIGFLVLITLLSCTGEKFSEPQLEQYLNGQEEAFEQISVSLGAEYWKLYTEEGTADLKIPKRKFAALFGDDTLNSTVDAWYDRIESINNAALNRRGVLWHNVLTGAKVNLEEEILNLTDQLETWLAVGPEPEEKPSNEEIKAAVIRLMKLRNEKAQEFGFDNYAEMILEITELDSGWFHSFVETFDKATLAPYQDLITKIKTEQNKTVIGIADIRSLVIQYSMFTQGPSINSERMLPLMKETAENIGIHYDALPVQFEERKMPPGVGGQGFALHIPDDFRAVVMPGLPFGARLHELGHGLQWMFTKTESPILKGYEWSLGNSCGAFAEGMAETMARFVQNPGWLIKYADTTEEELFGKKEKAQPLAPAYFRYLMNMFIFEVEFYKDLDQDPDELVQSLQKKNLLVDEPLKRPMSLTNMIYVSYPLYIQNYLIGDIISWQVHKTLEEKFGKDYAFNDEVGPYLVENLWKNGELLPWQIRLKNLTGKTLDIEGYLKSFGL
jgi:hypothetical protein